MDWRHRAELNIGDHEQPLRRRHRRGLDLTGIVNEKFADRFWSKVDRAGNCWEWVAHCKPNGYGQFTVSKGLFYGAHAVSYALAYGAIPPNMSICHHCDNPPCVNPDHLFMGTQSDNAFDMLAKGRANRSRGEDERRRLRRSRQPSRQRPRTNTA